jgi:hypothetical protein
MFLWWFNKKDNRFNKVYLTESCSRNILVALHNIRRAVLLVVPLNLAPGEAASLERSERIQRSTGTNSYNCTGFALQKQGFKVFGKQAYCFSFTAALLSAFIFL